MRRGAWSTMRARYEPEEELGKVSEALRNRTIEP
jgi:hypothetical protein